jgi:hypothetical protein
MNDPRRSSPRIDVEAMCWEVIDGQRASTCLAVDLSSMGVRVERPYVGGQRLREVHLEIEVPGIDEVMWARGDVASDWLIPTRSPAGGPLGFVRRTGYRLVLAAKRDLRRLEEVVFETDRLRRREQQVSAEMMFASCYMAG